MIDLSIETLISNIILLYIFYRYLMKIRNKKYYKEQKKKSEIISDENNKNYFKNIYLNEKIQYILKCVKIEREELREKTEDLYKLIVEYEKYEEKEQEFIQIKLDIDNENKYLKEKNKKLFKVIFKFLVLFEKEIEEYKNRENEFKIREEKYISDREEFKFLSLE